MQLLVGNRMLVK